MSAFFVAVRLIYSSATLASPLPLLCGMEHTRCRGHKRYLDVFAIHTWWFLCLNFRTEKTIRNKMYEWKVIHCSAERDGSASKSMEEKAGRTYARHRVAQLVIFAKPLLKKNPCMQLLDGNDWNGMLTTLSLSRSFSHSNHNVVLCGCRVSKAYHRAPSI